jgi:hypothetical protein
MDGYCGSVQIPMSVGITIIEGFHWFALLFGGKGGSMEREASGFHMEKGGYAVYHIA